MTFTKTHTETKENGIVIHNFRDFRGYEYHVVISEQHASIGQKMARSFEPGRGVYVWPLESWQAMDAAARRCIAESLGVPVTVKLDPDVTAAAVHARGPWWQRHYTILAQDSATPGR